MTTEITCPVCNSPITVKVDQTELCPCCHASFTARPATTSGLVIECGTDDVLPESAMDRAIIGQSMFLVLNREDTPEWLVRERRGGVVELSYYLKSPWASELTNTMK